MNDYAVIARELVSLLSPYCDRIEIAGSIRRGKPNPHDIEIVCAPAVETVELPPEGQGSLLDPLRPRLEKHNRLEETLAVLRGQDAFADRLDKNGRKAWGERYKRVYYTALNGERAPVDIFSVLPPAQWGVIFAIRTGPADFSHLLVTSRLENGAMPVDMRVSHGILKHGGKWLSTPEERDFFEALDVPYWEPEKRDPYRLRNHLAMKRYAARKEAKV